MTDAIDIFINATDKASPAINTVRSSLGGMNESAKESHGIFSSVGSLLTGSLAVAATAGAAAIGGLVFAFRDSADIAREHIQVERQLEAVLRSTGGAAGVSADMANKLADSMQKVTNFDGEAVLGGENLLLTFTNIGKDVFPRATESMLDMSQALGQDMKSSAVQLGKALNDPIAGVSALSRVGVTFTDQQKEQIKVMVEAGNVAGAQTLILDELAKEFGGSARAMVEPGKQLENMWGDLKEQVGMFLIPIFDDLAKRAMPILSAATDYLSGLVNKFNEHLSKGGSYADAFREVIKSVLPVIKDWTAAMWKWIVDSVPVVLQKLGEWAQQIANWFVGALPGFIRTFLEWETALWQWIGDTLPRAIRALADFVRGLRGEGDSTGGSAMSSMASGWAGKLWKWISEELIPAVKPAFMKFVDTMAHLGLDLLRELADLAKELGLTLWKWIVDITPIALKKLGEWGTALWGWVKENTPKWIEKLNEWGIAAWEWIVKVAIPGAMKKLDEWGLMFQNWIKENMPIWIENLKQAGINMILGLWEGLKEALPKLTNWFLHDTGLGRFIKDVMEMLEIGSPSRLFWGFGSDIIEGMALGIEQNMGRTRDAGVAMAHSIGAGLKSESQWIAEQIKATMDFATSEMNASVDYFTKQATAKALAASQAIANSVKDTSNLAKQLGIDPALLPPSMGGTGTVIGYGPNGELILAGAGDKLPGTMTAVQGAPTVPTTTIGGAVGGNITTGATGQGLLGGINLTTPDLAGAQTGADTAAQKVKDFIAGIGDFLAQTVSNSTMSKVFNDAFDSTVGAPGQGYVELQGAKDKIRQKMADLLGLPQIFGALDAKGNLEALTKTLGAGTDLDKVAGLLQSAVDFRTLANYYDTKDQYGSTLPNDPRLTGNATTTNYNITLQGSNNANADVLGLVQLLGSLQGSATP